MVVVYVLSNINLTLGIFSNLGEAQKHYNKLYKGTISTFSVKLEKFILNNVNAIDMTRFLNEIDVTRCKALNKNLVDTRTEFDNYSKEISIAKSFRLPALSSNQGSSNQESSNQESSNQGSSFQSTPQINSINIIKKSAYSNKHFKNQLNIIDELDSMHDIFVSECNYKVDECDNCGGEECNKDGECCNANYDY